MFGADERGDDFSDGSRGGDFDDQVCAVVGGAVVGLRGQRAAAGGSPLCLCVADCALARLTARPLQLRALVRLSMRV